MQLLQFRVGRRCQEGIETDAHSIQHLCRDSQVTDCHCYIALRHLVHRLRQRAGRILTVHMQLVLHGFKQHRHRGHHGQRSYACLYPRPAATVDDAVGQVRGNGANDRIAARRPVVHLLQVPDTSYKLTQRFRRLDNFRDISGVNRRAHWPGFDQRRQPAIQGLGDNRLCVVQITLADATDHVSRQFVRDGREWVDVGDRFLRRFERSAEKIEIRREVGDDIDTIAGIEGQWVILALGANGDRVTGAAVALEFRELGAIFREYANFGANDRAVADTAGQYVIRQRLPDQRFFLRGFFLTQTTVERDG